MAKVPRDVDADAALWDAYNLLLLGPDLDRIRKLVVRYELAKLAFGVPGDVVECGAFKGSGCLYWLKLLAILEPASLRRVIGFDTFSEFSPDQREEEREAISDFVERSGFAGADAAEIVGRAGAAGLDDRLEFVAGTSASRRPSTSIGIRARASRSSISISTHITEPRRPSLRSTRG